MRQLPAFVHISLVGSGDGSGELKRYVEYTKQCIQSYIKSSVWNSWRVLLKESRETRFSLCILVKHSQNPKDSTVKGHKSSYKNSQLVISFPQLRALRTIT